MGEGLTMPIDPHHTPIITQPSSSQHQKKQKSRRPKKKDTENTKTAQAQEISSLKLRVKKLEKKGWSRTHKLKRLYKVGRSARIVSSDEITLVDETRVRHDDIMFDVSDLAREETFEDEKKDQISFDEQEAIRLQAEFDEEVRLAREKDKANVALIEEWNDIQANINADYQLAQRLQAREQEELTIEERAKLFQQLLEKRR
ncbi:hypothetical protein Tco_0600003 [Tanacetum coccineum]|uniref:Uncharacterized protein n=1 Tax=Tanacetum coccineum TaxID=301880 RepID=A0ABQ4WAI9_9ASTR